MEGMEEKEWETVGVFYAKLTYLRAIGGKKRREVRESREGKGREMLGWRQISERLQGYKVECKGMFVRKHSNRSQKHVISQGKVSVNRKREDVEYTERGVTLRTGSCSVKVWVLKKNDNKVLESS